MPLWSGGRFSEEPADVMWRFTVDTSDRRLLAVDVEGSLAHVAMLGRVGLLDNDETEALTDGLITTDQTFCGIRKSIPRSSTNRRILYSTTSASPSSSSLYAASSG